MGGRVEDGKKKEGAKTFIGIVSYALKVSEMVSHVCL